MGLCLVTKLKESVADSSLSKIGEKSFLLMAGGQVTFRGKGVAIRTLNGETFNISVLGASPLNGISHYVDSSNTWFTLTNPSDTPIVIGVSDLENLVVFGTNDTGRSKQLEIDLSFFVYCNKMEDLQLIGETITGNLSNLAHIADNSTLYGLSFDSSSTLEGSISEISSLKMDNGVLPNFFNCSKVTGSVEDFVAGQRSVGRTTANISNNYWLAGSGITFNGENIFDMTSISWTESTITVNGTTINA